MKRFVGTLLGLVLVFAIGITARAEEYDTYYLEELEMEIRIPTDCIVFTRDLDETHPGLAHFGFTADDMLAVLESGSLYLDGIERNSEYEIAVVMEENSEGDMQTWDDDTLEVALQSRRQYLESRGHQCRSMEIVKCSQATFLRIDYCNTEGRVPIYVREYYTRYQNTMYGISLTTFGKELSGEQEQILQSVIDSIRFHVTESKSEPGSAERLYYSEELDMELLIPAESFFFTREIDPDDPNLGRIYVAADQMKEFMETNSVYLDIIAEDLSFEITFAMSDAVTKDLNQYSEKEIAELMKLRRTGIESVGAMWISASTVQNGQAKFLKTHYDTMQDGLRSSTQEYFTFYVGRCFVITMTSYVGQINEEMDEMITRLINSIHFGVEPTVSEPEPSVAKKYEDELTGMGFTLPVTWKSLTLPKQNRTISGKFTTYMDPAISILFTSRDLYGSGELEKLLPDLSVSERSEVDHALLTEELVAELIGCDVSEILATRYGGREYFRVEGTIYVKRAGKQEPTEACTLIRCENGYLYIFQFVGATDHPQFPKFQRMVANARYPGADDTVSNTEPKLETSEPTPAFEYRYDETGVTFTVPENISQMPLDGTEKQIRGKFQHNWEKEVIFMFLCVDFYENEEFWAEYPDDVKDAISRSDVSNDLLSREQVATTFGCAEENVTEVTYGGAEYFCLELPYKTVVNDEEVTLPFVILVRIENGYMYQFQFYGEKSSEYFPVFEQMMESVSYPPVEKKSDLMSVFRPLNLIFSIVMTVSIYSLPIFIYRWCIRRYPVEEKKAKIITIVYGIISWVLMSVVVFTINREGVAGGAVLLWAGINYKVLTGGKDKRRRKESEDPWD